MSPKLKKILTWGGFVVVIALIVWGLIDANNKAAGITNSSAQVTLNNPVTSSDWTTGSSTAPVTLVEYGDFQCPSCGAFYPVVKQLLAAEGPSRVYFAFRNFPLPQHPNAMIAAEAAGAAGLQGQFWAMHDMLYANQNDWVNLPDPTSVFEGYAAKIGINTAQFLTDLKSPDVYNRVISDLKQAEQNNLDYTPTFFVNGVRIDNPDSYADFKQLIDNAIASSTASTTAE
jgi:protein-disulfide isomerase